jgi:peptidoglycan/LPS O-acetylase OafA/YrhL
VVDAQPVRADDPGAAIVHVPALDGVRGIAIALVLALHFGGAADFPLRISHALGSWLDRLCYAGWTGVDLFFVLSGFLITTILLVSKEDPQYFRRFYGRRVLRIFPLYYTALILGLVLLPLLVADERLGLLPGGASGEVWLWTYTLNIGLALGWIASPITYFSHFWTLAIEEQFYLVWPGLVKVTSQRGLFRLCCAIVVAALAMRIAWVGLDLGWGGAYRFTLTRADSLAMGGAVAVLMRDSVWRQVLLKLAPFGLIASLGVTALMFLHVPRFYPNEWIVVTFGHSVVALASACLIVMALRAPASGPLLAEPLRALGKYSYGIYVWHFPLQRMLLTWYGTRPAQPSPGALLDALAFVTVGVIGSLLLGWVSYRLIERPFLRLKRFFVYSKVEPLEPRTSADPALASPAR